MSKDKLLRMININNNNNNNNNNNIIMGETEKSKKVFISQQEIVFLN